MLTACTSYIQQHKHGYTKYLSVLKYTFMFPTTAVYLQCPLLKLNRSKAF